jgi:hypothetical protein
MVLLEDIFARNGTGRVFWIQGDPIARPYKPERPFQNSRDIFRITEARAELKAGDGTVSLIPNLLIQPAIATWRDYLLRLTEGLGVHTY